MHVLSGYQRGYRASAPVKVESQKAVPPIEVPVLSLGELREKTDNFGSKALIGEGSYGRVYYANLNNGKAVALKKLDVSTEAESNVEFLTQVCQHSFWFSYLIAFTIIVFSFFFFSLHTYDTIAHSDLHGFKIEA